MSAAMPYVRWYGKDWLGDPMLRMVPPEVRGVWIDLLCAMMNAEPYGHLSINGKPMTDEQAARMTGLDIDTYKGILKQIEEAHISSRNGDGLLYCRRLVRDHEKFLTASNAGKKGGGNPALQKKSRVQNPEYRSHKPEAKGTIKGTFIDTYKGSFEEAWKAYPDKSGKTRAAEAYAKHRKAGDTQEQILDGIERYKAYVAAKRAGGQDLNWRNGQTFFYQAGWRDEFVIAELPPVGSPKPRTGYIPPREYANDPPKVTT